MKKFTLSRVAENKYGTFGVLIDELTPFCLTLERRWLDNKVGESCIPTGTYICQRVQSPKFGNTFEVMDVPGRTLILFHMGNLVEDTHGCIILGERYDPLNGRDAILSSGDAHREFMSRLKNVDKSELHVFDVRVTNE